MTTTTRPGPKLTIVGSCDGCPHLRSEPRSTLGVDHHVPTCAHPARADGGLIFARGRGPYPTPDDCPELAAARLDLLVDLARTVCRRCGKTVEPQRECYAIPTCFACLPPPPPLPVLPFPSDEEIAALERARHTEESDR